MRAGFAPGLAWHAAKILECGAAAVVNRKTPDCMFAWLRDDHFVVEAPDPELRCTPQSIASHSLYENADPFRLVECSGTLDLTGKPLRSRRRARGAGKRQPLHSRPTRYTVKLEGAEKAGYQSIVIGSVRDPFIIRQIDDWTARLEDRIHARVKQVYGAALKPGDYHLNIRIYGKNGTMGPLEPVKEIRSHELCLLIEVTAPAQEIASAIAGIMRHQGLHLPIPEWSGLITALACPYNPAHLDRGAVYRFNVNHVVEPDDPYEMFPMELCSVAGGTVTRGAAHDQARRTRAPDPQQERRTVRTHLRHHVRRRRHLSSASSDPGALTREAIAARYGLPPADGEVLLLATTRWRSRRRSRARSSRAICATATDTAASSMRR